MSFPQPESTPAEPAGLVGPEMPASAKQHSNQRNAAQERGRFGLLKEKPMLKGKRNSFLTWQRS